MWKRHALHAGMLVATLGACFVAGSWLGQSRASEASRSARVAPFVAPETIRSTTLDGVAVDLDLTSRRRPLLALVLSTSCEFCRANMEVWVELVATVAASGQADVMVVSTSGAADTAELLDKHDLELPVSLVGNLAAALPGVPGVPATLLIQPSTRRVEGIVGVLDRDALRSLDEWINEH